MEADMQSMEADMQVMERKLLDMEERNSELHLALARSESCRWVGAPAWLCWARQPGCACSSR
jgi:hypothetical protein